MARQIKAIILMGGEGLRFTSSLPKQFHRISGKKVYLYALERAIYSDLFDEIILVCPHNFEEEVKEDLTFFESKIPIKIVTGGKTRQESSYLGLLACGNSTEFVLIHDGVRPFVSQKILKANIESVKVHRAVDTCISSADTLVHSTKGNFIDSIPKRSEYFRGQTPQTFYYPLILEAHEKAKKKGVHNSSDDCSLILSMGHKVAVIEGSERNIKITTMLDLSIAEQLLRLEQKLDPSSNCSLAGKYIAVTGGTGGIGQAICCLLEKEKAIPLILSKSSKQFPVDLTNPKLVEQIFQKIHREIGLLDGLINCIGKLHVNPLHELSIENIHDQMNTNFLSIVFCCKYAKVKPNGHVINIASSSYFRGRKNYPLYSSAKAAVVNFSQALSEEHLDLNINVLVPQRTKTKMRQTNFPQEKESSLLDPSEVAKTAIELLKQKRITGTIIEVKKENIQEVLCTQEV